MPEEGDLSSLSLLTASTLAVSHSQSPSHSQSLGKSQGALIAPWRDKDLPSLPSSATIAVIEPEPQQQRLYLLTGKTLPATPDTTDEDDDDEDDDDDEEGKMGD